MSPRVARWSGTWRVGLLALIWGANFMWIKLADRGIPPVEVTLARLVLGTAVLYAIVFAYRHRLPRSVRVWAHLAVAALFGNAIPYLLFAVGEQTANSSTAGILNATTPLWTVAAALASRHQRGLKARTAFGLMVGFTGAVLVFTPWRATSALVSVGAAETLAAAVSYGISYVYMERYLARRGLNSVTVAAGQLLAASVWIAIALPVTGARAPRLGSVTVASILVLGLLGTGIAYVLNYQIITREGAAAASTVTYLLPVVAIFLGVAVLGEHITWAAFGGIALILVGVAVVRRRADHGHSGRTPSERQPATDATQQTSDPAALPPRPPKACAKLTARPAASHVRARRPRPPHARIQLSRTAPAGNDWRSSSSNLA